MSQYNIFWYMCTTVLVPCLVTHNSFGTVNRNRANLWQWAYTFQRCWTSGNLCTKDSTNPHCCLSVIEQNEQSYKAKLNCLENFVVFFLERMEIIYIKHKIYEVVHTANLSILDSNFPFWPKNLSSRLSYFYQQGFLFTPYLENTRENRDVWWVFVLLCWHCKVFQSLNHFQLCQPGCHKQHLFLLWKYWQMTTSLPEAEVDSNTATRHCPSSTHSNNFFYESLVVCRMCYVKWQKKTHTKNQSKFFILTNY